MYQLLTQHWVTLHEDYVIATDYYGNSVYHDPLGLSVFPVGGGRGGSGEPASQYHGTYYQYITFSHLIYLGLTDVTKSSSDEEPVVTSVSPSDWQPGSTVSVVIDGSGFGPAPDLEISPTSDLQWSVDSVNSSGTQILARVTVGSSADPGGRILSVTSSGSTGLGFVGGPGKSAKSNAHRVTIAGTNCEVSITNDGQSYPLNTNNYRQATIPLLATSSCSGTVSWSLTFFYRTTGWHTAQRWGPYMSSSTLNSTLNFTTDIGVGGQADIVATVTINGVSTKVPARFHVTGTLIPVALVTAKLKSLYANGLTPALLTGIANKESTYDRPGVTKGQFSTLVPTSPARPLMPLGVGGYWPTEPTNGGSNIGLMQVVAKPAVAWNWEENALKGLEVLQWALGNAKRYETAMKTKCKGKLKPMDALSSENNALRFYRYGGDYRYAYTIPDKDCRTWIRSPYPDTEQYVEEVRRHLR